MAGNTSKRSKPVDQVQLRSFARSIVGVEWLLLVLVVLYVFVIRPDVIRDPVVVTVLAAFALSLIALRFLPRVGKQTERNLSIGILVMVLFLTVILRQLGQTSGGLLNLYLLPIVAAAMALGRRGAIWTTLIVCLSYFALAITNGRSPGLSPVVLTEAATVLMPLLLVAFLTSRLADDIEASGRQVKTLSDRDWLTGALHVGAFVPAAERAHQELAAKDATYSVLIIDIDRLKQINETYGFAAGNKAIRTVAEALQRVTSGRDLVGRFGGDEFVAMLPNSQLTQATEVAQRLRNVVYASTFEVNVDIVRVQVNVGVANYPIDGDTVTKVLAAADRAMSKDKELRTRPEGQLVIQKR